MISTETTRVLTINSCPQNSLLRLIWEELGRRYPPTSGQSILIYGAGKFVKSLLRLIVPFPKGPVIVGIVDDSATPGQTMSGHRVLKPDQINPEDFSAVFLGTDYFEDRLAKRCRAAYGANCVILRYSKLVKEVLSREQPWDGADAITKFLRPSHGDPFIDISSVWELAYGLCHHHECNEFKDNLLLAIALNIKPANSERATEYGFALRQLTSGCGQLMDIGSSDSLFPYLLADKGFSVTCLDPIEKTSKDPRIEIIEGDIRKTNLPEEQFDVVTCISTLEHIGLPGRYGITEADPKRRKKRNEGNVPSFETGWPADSYCPLWPICHAAIEPGIFTDKNYGVKRGAPLCDRRILLHRLRRNVPPCHSGRRFKCGFTLGRILCARVLYFYTTVITFRTFFCVVL